MLALCEDYTRYGVHFSLKVILKKTCHGNIITGKRAQGVTSCRPFILQLEICPRRILEARPPPYSKPHCLQHNWLGFATALPRFVLESSRGKPCFLSYYVIPIRGFHGSGSCISHVCTVLTCIHLLPWCRSGILIVFFTWGPAGCLHSEIIGCIRNGIIRGNNVVCHMPGGWNYIHIHHATFVVG